MQPGDSISDSIPLAERLGYQFARPELLRVALTHPSYVADAPKEGSQNNQRLEFLGDAVLQLVLSRALFEKFPDCDEGTLTKARARLVNRRTLAEHGRTLGLGELLRMSRGEAAQGGRERASALADAFEAVVGAIFLDGGYEAVERFILARFHEALNGVRVIPVIENPKGELQEFLQAESPESPRYQVVSVTGPDHDREYECTVLFRGAELGRGRGKSKKAAESEAARNALHHLRAASPEGGNRPVDQLPESPSI